MGWRRGQALGRAAAAGAEQRPIVTADDILRGARAPWDKQALGAGSAGGGWGGRGGRGGWGGWGGGRAAGTLAFVREGEGGAEEEGGGGEEGGRGGGGAVAGAGGADVSFAGGAEGSGSMCGRRQRRRERRQDEEQDGGQADEDEEEFQQRLADYQADEREMERLSGGRGRLSRPRLPVLAPSPGVYADEWRGWDMHRSCFSALQALAHETQEPLEGITSPML
jgi:hypothetical protein